MFKKQNGITLVALAITIIVLLILAGVAITTLVGEDSIIGNANKAVTDYNADEAAENKLINDVEKLFIKYNK